MAYAIKRSTTTQNNTLKKGRFVIGTEAAEYDSSYYNGVEPVSNGFMLIIEGTPPTFYSFSNESDLVSYYNREHTSVSTLSDVLTAISTNDAHLLVRADTPSTIDAEPKQKGRNLTNSPAAEGKFVRGKGRKSKNDTQHGFEWVCLVSATIDYCAIYSGTVISEINPSTGALTTKVSSTSNPQAGQFSVTAGRVYTSNKPVAYLEEASHHCIAPLSYRRKMLGSYGNRGFSATVRIYATEDNTNVTIFRDKINGTVVATATNLSEGDIETFTLSSANQSKYMYYVSNKEIIGTIDHGGLDRYILPVISSEYIYTRSGEHERNTLGQDPQGQNSTNVIQDNAGAFVVDIADGNGGDADCGVPLNFLTDTYAFGSGPLRSYYIVSPYTNTITVSYWNGSSWVQYGSHVENGTLSSPSIHAEGSQNGSNNLVDSTERPWKFEGTNPFYIVVNDGSADEEALFGWNRNEKILCFSF